MRRWRSASLCRPPCTADPSLRSVPALQDEAWLPGPWARSVTCDPSSGRTCRGRAVELQADGAANPAALRPRPRGIVPPTREGASAHFAPGEAEAGTVEGVTARDSNPARPSARWACVSPRAPRPPLGTRWPAPRAPHGAPSPPAALPLSMVARAIHILITARPLSRAGVPPPPLALPAPPRPLRAGQGPWESGARPGGDRPTDRAAGRGDAGTGPGEGQRDGRRTEGEIEGPRDRTRAGRRAGDSGGDRVKDAGPQQDGTLWRRWPALALPAKRPLVPSARHTATRVRGSAWPGRRVPPASRRSPPHTAPSRTPGGQAAGGGPTRGRARPAAGPAGEGGGGAASKPILISPVMSAGQGWRRPLEL